MSTNETQPHDDNPASRTTVGQQAEGIPAEYAVENGWLVELVNEHTCGAGPGSGAGHEPGCGMIPIDTVENLLRSSAATAALAWDAAVASLRYADGTPVEVLAVVNPYRVTS